MLFKNPWSDRAQFLPKYKGLESAAAMETPIQIVNWEASTEFTQMCERQTRTLIGAVSKAPTSHPFFFSALLPEDEGLITVQSRDGRPSRCAVVFTSETRAAVYADLLFGGLKLTPISFTPAALIEILASLSKLGIRHFVLDRCPRCWGFLLSSSLSIPTPEDAIGHWAFMKAVELTRANSYLKLALQRSRSGDYASSRDITLHAIAHVAPDDSRFHTHLLSLAENLQDKMLLLEAKNAVRYITPSPWIGAVLNDLAQQITDSGLWI